MTETSSGYEIERLYKPEEAAKVLNVSRAQVYRLIRLGQLPYILVGCSTRIHPNDLREYMKKRKRKKEI